MTGIQRTFQHQRNACWNLSTEFLAGVSNALVLWRLFVGMVVTEVVCLVPSVLVLEKIEMDDEVDIFQVVRAMQIRRPEFFSNFDQYEYCYKTIKEHLTGDSLYANV